MFVPNFFNKLLHVSFCFNSLFLSFTEFFCFQILFSNLWFQIALETFCLKLSYNFFIYSSAYLWAGSPSPQGRVVSWPGYDDKEPRVGSSPEWRATSTPGCSEKWARVFALPRRVRRVRKLAEPTRIRIGSWNIGSLTGKLRELVDAAIRRRVNILCVQETKWKGQKAKEVEDTGFKLWYRGQLRVGMV